MVRSASSSGSVTPLNLAASASTTPRSSARAPPVRPYRSALCSRADRIVREVAGDTKDFGDLVVGMVEKRARKARGGNIIDSGGEDARKGRSLGGSLAGSWERERAELIVDIPVWSPGCFQDLTTLHALRDTTLTHTHSLLAYLLRNHSIPASYRLLARSSTSQSSGWGCIRLAPLAASSPASPKTELRPVVRRSSLVSDVVRRPPMLVPTFNLDQAIADEDESEGEDEGTAVTLKESYISHGASDDGIEEQSADVMVAREVEKRGAQEGTAFLMTLFGQPALILL
ncbi:MAG: hypothetical protein TREMPRED_002093 [Tremellales sp. Tagirdzhanova-0007]|nr:MAG: hypothetical protein TREMPRED_002093 [Tremellales sp. Tagirdzhanova-0007]